MLNRQDSLDNKKYRRLSAWKRLLLISGLLLPGGSLALLTTGQTVYADPYLCQAGHGGNGGIATNGSNGAAGAPGGSCNLLSAQTVGAPGGDHWSPGGDGGWAVFE